ncbi:hypothetical protein LNV09_10545 [Paucibacter sp. B2R-40]|jgi:hypothetical protein|uniref:hypothetical protein n=1 Tax=Paucibacter sp. B2R-40 TaxID=2893554 RepID=UPI0021E4394D|nr:hypothetical protein [Paucibacter sp. B2R-40]MCV2354601.1 hypothetical protein [Paucibacter sp. B2R-40]
MNKMFKRIAALLDSQAMQNSLAWAARHKTKPDEQTAAASEHAEGDFRDTDIAVAWLCEASNKTRTSSQGLAH